VLERQPGADTAGYSGLEDGVDNRWGALFKAALLSKLLGVCIAGPSIILVELDAATSGDGRRGHRHSPR
jgi:type IV secretory pathway VirB10-like protein